MRRMNRKIMKIAKLLCLFIQDYVADEKLNAPFTGNLSDLNREKSYHLFDGWMTMVSSKENSLESTYPFIQRKAMWHHNPTSKVKPQSCGGSKNCKQKRRVHRLIIHMQILFVFILWMKRIQARCMCKLSSGRKVGAHEARWNENSNEAFD